MEPMGRRAVSGPRLAALAAAALGLAAARPASAEPDCAPRVQVSGDPALAGPIIALLRQRGVPVEPPSACGTLTAVLTASGERLRVTIVDADGRTVERMAEDASAAATAIESWARRDVSAPLLAARVVPPSGAQTLDRDAPPEPAVPPQREQRVVEVGAAVEAGRDSGDTMWRGARAQACVRLGPVCAGGMVRYAADTHSGEANIRDTRRFAVDALAAAEVPLRLGRVTLVPGAAVGLTALRAIRRSGDDEQIDRFDLATRAGLGAGFRVTGAWSLRADLALSYAPFGPALLHEITSGDDTADQNDAPPLAGFAVQGWLGVGLTYGGL
jgi:hypothetical protein